MRRRRRHEDLAHPCYSVWDAESGCTAWNGNRYPFHGCELHGGHHGPHRCRCGHLSTTELPPPQVGR